MYSAPELTSVSLNTRTEYKAADSYSLGMVLYELLTRTQQGQGMHTETSDEDSQGQKVIIKTSASRKIFIAFRLSNSSFFYLLCYLRSSVVIGGTKKERVDDPVKSSISSLNYPPLLRHTKNLCAITVMLFMRAVHKFVSHNLFEASHSAAFNLGKS